MAMIEEHNMGETIQVLQAGDEFRKNLNFGLFTFPTDRLDGCTFGLFEW
jgi:hypothetical protein